MKAKPKRIERCPALGLGMEHVWSVPRQMPDGEVLRLCLWCSERRPLADFPDYDGPILDGTGAMVRTQGVSAPQGGVGVPPACAPEGAAAGRQDAGAPSGSELAHFAALRNGGGA